MKAPRILESGISIKIHECSKLYESPILSGFSHDCCTEGFTAFRYLPPASKQRRALDQPQTLVVLRSVVSS